MKLPAQPQPVSQQQLDKQRREAIRADMLRRVGKPYKIFGTTPVMGPTRGGYLVNLNAWISEEEAGRLKG